MALSAPEWGIMSDHLIFLASWLLSKQIDVFEDIFPEESMFSIFVGIENRKNGL